MSNKKIFTPSVGHALDCVLKELLLISNRATPKVYSDDVAIQMFSRYFSEAKQSIERGVVKDLENLRLAPLEKEFGVRLACFVKSNFKAGDKEPTLKLYIISPIEAWLKNPTKEPYIAELFQRFINLNLSLNDDVAREIIKTTKAV